MMSGSSSAVAASTWIFALMRANTTGQFDAERWYTTRPANFAISVFIDRIDEHSTADVRSYDTECCGNVADV